jgi:hypothetical protein
MMIYGYIFITTNTINGKRYIGMYREGRRQPFSRYFGSGKALRRAIRKYGSENFIKEIIYTASSKEELSSKEIELIAQYNCVADPTWYNIAEGGYTTRG